MHREALLKDCQNSFHYFQNIHIQFIHREGNHVTDILSKHACQLELFQDNVFLSASSFLLDVLRHEQKGRSISRSGHMSLINRWKMIE